MGASSSKVALVTGTSSGVGAAVAHALLAAKWRVIGIARRPAAIEHSAYTHLPLDLSDVTALSACVDREAGPLLFGRTPAPLRLGLVNCAADVALLGPVDRIAPAAMLRAFAVNVVAATWLMGWMIRRTPASTPIRIVNVSSGADASPFPGLASYGGTKAALRMAGMVLGTELDQRASAGEGRDVTILSYQPGIVDTPMQDAARGSATDVLPSVEMFRQFAQERRLVPPSQPAADIAAYLDHDGAATFEERRLGATAARR